MRAAIDAEARGDSAVASRNLLAADDMAKFKHGLFWRFRLQFTKPIWAKLFYRTGQLDRAAGLTFKLLEQTRAST